MDQKSFDWFEDTIEVDVPEFQATEKGKGLAINTLIFIIFLSKYLILLTGILWVYRLVFGYNQFMIMGMNLNAFIETIFLASFTIFIVKYLMKIISIFVSRLRNEGIISKFIEIYSWLSFSIWFALQSFLFETLYVEDDEFRVYLKSYLQCGLLLSITFTILTFILECFNEYFIEKNLQRKMVDVEVRERIILAMKKYRYEMSSSTTEMSEENIYRNFLGWITGKNEASDQEDVDEIDHIEFGKEDTKKIGDLYFKKPELKSVVDAKTLARDVFLSACGDEERLSFSHFSNIFPNSQIAIQAFQFFDLDDDGKIGKKEFRDTIIEFYVDRINLERSFHMLKGFVNLIEDIIRGIVFAVIFLISLIIFGVPLKELTALAFSSALLLNFMGSGIASEIYSSFMMVLSHPYDVGDDIIVNDKDLKVYKITLVYTSFIEKNGGKVKILNSELWKKNLINMTRAPEKILMFKFNLSKNLRISAFNKLKEKIHLYLRTRPFDFYEEYSLEAKSEQSIDINLVECHLILKCKGYKTKSKKFNLRVEVTKMLREIIKELAINEK